MSPRPASRRPRRRPSAGWKPAPAPCRSAGSTASPRRSASTPPTLVEGGSDSPELQVAAVLGANGATAPKRTGIVVPPRAQGGPVAVTVAASAGDYRAGDEIWCETLQPDDFAPGAQPRRAGAPPRRPLPVRAADRPRGRQAAPASARRGRPAERRHRPAVDRDGGETGPEPLAAPAVEPPMFFMFSNQLGCGDVAADQRRHHPRPADRARLDQPIASMRGGGR